MIPRCRTHPSPLPARAPVERSSSGLAQRDSCCQVRPRLGRRLSPLSVYSVCMYAHVELRAVTEADLPVLFEHQDDPVLRALSVVPHWPREAFLSRWRERLTSPDSCARTIWADGQLVGCIMSFPRDGRREVGYILGRAFWGGRIGTRALRLFLSCDATRPLSAVISKHNVASIKMAQTCGFVQTEELPAKESAGERAAVVLTLFA